MNQRLTPVWAIVGLLALLALTTAYRRSNPRTASFNESHMAYKAPFYLQWIREHEAYPYDCWSDSGYDSSKSEFSRDVQLLAAMDYGKSDIDNGGFHQFFYNSTGVFAPEMLEWCLRNDLPDVARIIEEAMRFFGEEYPRDRDVRTSILPEFQARDGRDWDPFGKLNEKFYASLSNNGNRYKDAADHWLRATCGVSLLDDTEKGRTKP